MDAKSEVILRQRSFFAENVLLVNPPQDMLCQEFSRCQMWTWNFADHLFFQRQSVQSHFAITPPQNDFAQAIIFVPKAKERLAYILEQCAALLGQGKDIFLVGEKKAGIDGAATLLKTFGKAIKLDSARHCQLWQVRITQTVQLRQLQDWYKIYSYQNQQNNLQIYALPGVFSQNRLDVGTAELLPFLSQIHGSHILDFGCGAGILGAILAQNHPQCHITAVDIDAFALQSTQMTFQHNGLAAQLQTEAVGGIDDVQGTFDVIVSNPPFHQGIKTHYQASEQLCRLAPQCLNPNGELWIVANHFLNYSPLIQDSFGHCALKADRNGFKVYSAHKDVL